MQYIMLTSAASQNGYKNVTEDLFQAKLIVKCKH